MSLDIYLDSKIRIEVSAGFILGFTTLNEEKVKDFL